MQLSRSIRLLLLGAPGSGKGTQTSKLLNAFSGIKALSSGDSLRAEIAKKSHLGIQASQFIDAGKLVPDSIMVGMITEQLKANDWLNSRSSWLLDGFPRTPLQANELDKVLKTHSTDLNLVVELNVSQEVILKRVEARWIHVPSGRVYNLDYNPPKVAYRDDITGEPLLKRSDDTAEVFQKRLDIYNKEIDPLKEHYQRRGILVTISGNTSDLIFPQLESLVRSKFL